MKKTLVIIDIQNDITKNYKEIIGNINKAIDWAVDNDVYVVCIRHENLSTGTRTFKPNTRGAELVSDLKIVSKNVFTKYKGMKEETCYINIFKLGVKLPEIS
jgi:nicotinamidase-related amidase